MELSSCMRMRLVEMRLLWWHAACLCVSRMHEGWLQYRSGRGVPGGRGNSVIWPQIPAHHETVRGKAQAGGGVSYPVSQLQLCPAPLFALDQCVLLKL